jgi:Zn finger protein HypA/HybF involved in hydrogenase expression
MASRCVTIYQAPCYYKDSSEPDARIDQIDQVLPALKEPTHTDNETGNVDGRVNALLKLLNAIKSVTVDIGDVQSINAASVLSWFEVLQEDDVSRWIHEARKEVKLEECVTKGEGKLLWLATAAGIGEHWGLYYSELLQALCNTTENGNDNGDEDVIWMLEEAYKILATLKLEEAEARTLYD